VGNELLIGDNLRQARLNKNISLDELQQKTKIQKRYLEAIEKGAFDLLPGDYYVRTFIRQYAEVVGGNGDRLVAIYDGEASFGDPLPKREKPETVQGSRSSSSTKQKRKKNWVDYLPTVLIGLIAMTILTIVAYLSIQNNAQNPIIGSPSSIDVRNEITTETTTEDSTEETDSTQSTETTTTSETQEKEEMVIKTTHQTQQDVTVSIEHAQSPLELTFIGLDGRCWVGVMVNGEYVLQYTLEPGDSQSVTLPEGATQANIVLGASANVDMKANGELIPFKEGTMPLLQKNITLTVSYAMNR